MIITVTLTPALDKTVVIPNFSINHVNRILQLRTDPGGKGINVSKVLKEYGCDSLAMGILGGPVGADIKARLDQMGIYSHFIFTPDNTRTNLKIIDPDLGTNTDINEPGPQVSAGTLEQMRSVLLSQLSPDDIVVLAGKLPPGASPSYYGTLIRLCRERQAKVFLDTDAEFLAEGIKEGPFMIKPNLDELERTCGCRLESIEAVYRQGHQLLEKGISLVVVSLGREGALFLTKHESIWGHGIPVSVKSTVGAGDSMLAAVAWAVSQKMSLVQTVRLAIASSTANVMRSGTDAAPYNEIEPFLQQVQIHYLS